MKVLTYRELESKDGLVPLLDHAFNWVFNQDRSEKIAKNDPKLKNSPMGFCAVEDGRIIGHVGVMDLVTCTMNGIVERAGGIYGVATLPGYTRRGVFTNLMNSAHEHFMEKNYRFSLLCTSPTLIAYGLYKRLGYVDLVEYPTAYKVVKAEKRRTVKKGKTAKLDFDKILGIYNEFTKDKTGLVIRDKPSLKWSWKTEGIKPKQCIVGEEGYVVFKEDKAGTWIRELVALNVKEMHRLIGLMEERTRGVVYDRAVLDKTLLEVYRSRGYMIMERGYSLIMFKPLTTGLSFKQVYGDKFHLSRLDAF